MTHSSSFSPATGKLDKLRTLWTRRDFSSLAIEVERYVYWQRLRIQEQLGMLAPQDAPRRLAEDEFWDASDIDEVREGSWLTLGQGILGLWALQAMADGITDIMDLIRGLLATEGPRRGLAMGCGDMVAEIGMFTHPALPFSHVEGHDISFVSLQRAQQLCQAQGLPASFVITDANRLQLPADHYDLIVCNHAFHHFTEIDHVAAQINRALKPGGVFTTFDYVGERFQQYSDAQLAYANQINRLLPYHLRRRANGLVRTVVERPNPAGLSPDEAICADLILPALDHHLSVQYQYNWAGLLMPLLEEISPNFHGPKHHDLNHQVDEESLALLRLLFDL
ncbi:MAG: class I SAM-dependent methyltransferase, partial [Caldilineaceae bacterium]|nr:class I SAM-dependent methyltransferase [Caldilineaceae bacterium]